MGSDSIKRVNFNHIKIKEPNIREQRDFSPMLSRNDSNQFSKISKVKVLKVESPHVDNNDILPHNSPLGHRNGMQYVTESSLMRSSIEPGRSRKNSVIDERASSRLKAEKEVWQLGA